MQHLVTAAPSANQSTAPHRLAVGLAFLAFSLAGCSSMSLEEAACRHTAATADCPTFETEGEIEACIVDWERLSAENEALGCGDVWDAVLDCYARTPFVCSGDNWAECNTEEAAWADCCSRDGMTCPTTS